ncbi:MAG TPA: alpha/beta hydrolase [Vicinamibacteria bacterium]|nr:alpha/beta hydrolase [Vicinamibacteria bacterium]
MEARAAGKALLRILALLAAIAALMLLFERRLIYFPQRALELTPRALGLPYEDLALRAEDGVRLHGWFLPFEGSRLTLLVCHGNGGNISHRLDRALAAQAQLGTDVLLFDYRGYGGSEGSPDEEGTYRDARAAWRWLLAKGQPPGRIVIFGESLGSAVALQLALDTEGARALVLESPFASIPEMARSAFPFLPVWPLVRTRYDNLAKVGRLRLPLLVMHGERDSVVPFAQGRRVFEAAPQPKRFYGIPGASHNDTYLVGGEAYWRALREFLATP